ncbi:unnamed protein product [Choristocarpus tenellus]
MEPHQYMFLVEGDKDERFSMSGLKSRPSPGEELKATITTFAHPRTGDHTRFMLVGQDLLEIQASRPRDHEQASFFIDQSVQADGTVYTATRVDPLFLLLPVLKKHATKWCPLDQALAEADCGGLKGLRHLDASKLCDVNDRLGPETILYRLNEDSVLTWLTSKVERAAARFQEIADEAEAAARAAGGGIAGFAAGFATLQETGPPCVDKEKREGGKGAIGGDCGGGIHLGLEVGQGSEKGAKVGTLCTQQALEVVSEYVADEWVDRLAECFRTERSVLFGGKDPPSKKRKGVWEETAESDRILEFTHGTGSGGKGKAEPAASTKSKAQTAGQRSLAKVNKKGMKSITSFFKA